MKCVISGQNAIVLAKAIHSFARIGHELFLEAVPGKGISFRTVNMTKSGFAMIFFNLDFFTSFTTKSNSEDPYENQCKLSMKSCLGVFRNMKQVESCIIKIDTKDFKLIVQFKCKLETVRTHHIAIIEQEGLQASYAADQTLNMLAGNYKLFGNIISNFKINEEELSIIATERNINVQNYLEGSHVDNNFVRSSIKIKPEEFENFKIAEETTIVFCMRELRAILGFAESMNASVSANFDTAGDPIVFVIKNFDTFEANLVMSTMSPEDMEMERNRGPPENTENSIQRKKNESKKSIDTESESIPQGKRHFTNSLDNAERSHHSQLEVVQKKRRISTDTEMNDVLRDGRISHDTGLLPNVAVPMDSEDIQVVFQEDSEKSGATQRNEDTSYMSMPHGLSPNENISENIPIQPRRDHRYKMREVFNVCFTGGSQPSFNYGKVLAECSDEDE